MSREKTEQMPTPPEADIMSMVKIVAIGGCKRIDLPNRSLITAVKEGYYAY